MLQGFGAFPSETRARVVWVGASQGLDKFSDLQKSVDEALHSLGFGKERSYGAHMTVVRVKGVTDKKKFLDFFDKHRKTAFGSFLVNKVEIYKSTLTPSGPVYEELDSFDLK